LYGGRPGSYVIERPVSRWSPTLARVTIEDT
jgi:hypothetical protein